MTKNRAAPHYNILWAGNRFFVANSKQE